MDDAFHVHPKETDSEHILREENVKTWYVMEGDYVHFKCSSPDEALRILGYLKENFPISKDQRKNIDIPIFYEINEINEIKVDAYSLIATMAARQLGLKISTTRKEPLPDIGSESQLDKVNISNELTPENDIGAPKSKTKYDI